MVYFCSREDLDLPLELICPRESSVYKFCGILDVDRGTRLSLGESMFRKT